MPRGRKNKEYYAIITGRIEQPTIFSSWGDAHPRITGYPSDHKGFIRLDEARDYMKERGVTDFKEVIKSEAGDTTPLDGDVFYAVANGANPGIYHYYHGDQGAEREITREEGSCHKRFRTQEQAESFIEDFKDSYAEVWRRLVRESLDRGFTPHKIRGFRDGDIRSVIEKFLSEFTDSDEVDSLVKPMSAASLQDK